MFQEISCDSCLISWAPELGHVGRLIFCDVQIGCFSAELLFYVVGFNLKVVFRYLLDHEVFLAKPKTRVGQIAEI